METQRSRRMQVLLVLNAVVLLLVLMAVFRQDNRTLAGAPASLTAATPAAPVDPATPSARGFTVMPAQIAPQTWGCYLIDNDNQTLCVYQYVPGEHTLRLAAARDVQYDRKLPEFNTTPSPAEIKEWVERAAEPVRTVTPRPVSPETTQP